jgi:hypothetical protein
MGMKLARFTRKALIRWRGTGIIKANGAANCEASAMHSFTDSSNIAINEVKKWQT